MSFSVFAGMKTSSPNDGVLLCLRMFILLFYFVFVCYYFRILIVFLFSPILSLGINGRFSNVYLEMVRIFKRSLVFLIMFFFLLLFFSFFFFSFFLSFIIFCFLFLFFLSF